MEVVRQALTHSCQVRRFSPPREVGMKSRC